MRAKIGDVVIDRTYNKKGNLAIVVGEGISQPILIYHKGGITMDKLRDYFATWDGLEVIGHIDFEKVWEKAVRTADRKTEPLKIELTAKDLQDWKDRMWAEAIVTEPTTEDCSTVPTSSKMEQVEDDPQTEMPRCSVNGTPFDECGFCEYFNCDTCKCEADVPQTERSK